MVRNIYISYTEIKQTLYFCLHLYTFKEVGNISCKENHQLLTIFYFLGDSIQINYYNVDMVVRHLSILSHLHFCDWLLYALVTKGANFKQICNL